MTRCEHGDGITPVSLLADYLDSEPHPSFVSHLSEAKTDLILDHANLALRSHTHTYKLVIKAHDQESSAPAQLLHQFASNSNRTSAPRVGAPITFSGIQWAPKIVGGRWVVMTAVDEVELHGRSRPSAPAEDDSGSGSGSVGQASPDFTLGAVYPHGHLGDLEYLDRVRQFDWTSSSCGPVASWPDELRQAYQMALAVPEPVCIMWGNDFTLIYNKPWSLLPGDRHPRAFGRPMTENWPETFPVYSKIFGMLKHDGQSVKHENVSRIMVRDGFPEQIFANLTFSPILSKDGSVVGIWAAVGETTRQVMSEKRVLRLIELGNRLAPATTLSEMWKSLDTMLVDCQDDFQFAAVYQVSSLPNESTNITLHFALGVHDMDERHQDLNAAIHSSFTSGATTILTTADGTLSGDLMEYLQRHGAPGSCRDLVLQPLKCRINDDTVAVMLMGINPLRKYDRDFQSFTELLTRQIESSITVIRNLANEKALLEQEFAAKMDRRFWNFAEKAPIGIYTYDHVGTMVYCNKAFEVLVGVPQAALARPMGWIDVVHPDCVEDVKAVWNRLVSIKDYTETFDVQFTKAWAPRGKNEYLDRTWCLATSYPEVGKNGEVVGIIGCAMDISSLKWAERIQSERLSEALELKRQQGNFFDVTSHELRNPLGAIIHSAYELINQLSELETQKIFKDDELVKDLMEMATTIVYCGNHQKRILDDVLTLSKLDSQLIQVFPISTDPSRLLKEVVSIFSSELRSSGISLEMIVGDGFRSLDVDAVMIDPHRITQVIVNLLSNAIKFTTNEPKRHICLRVDAFLAESDRDSCVRYVSSGTYHRDPTNDPEWGAGQPLYLAFSIQDTGPGLTEEESSRLFKQFSQASPRTHAQYGGSGLGLFISRELTEMHGGRIGLSSKHGSGSLFSFYIKARLTGGSETIRSPVINAVSYPAIQQLQISNSSREDATEPLTITAYTQSDIKSVPAASTTAISTRRVLVVEDNDINQRLLKKLLLKHNYQVTVANNGQEALDVIVGSSWSTASNEDGCLHIDLVLSDIEMPVMDGKTCVRRIRQLQKEGKLQPEIPVIALTGNAQRDKINEARDCGFNDVITKPYSIPELLQTVHEYSTKHCGFG